VLEEVRCPQLSIRARDDYNQGETADLVQFNMAELSGAGGGALPTAVHHGQGRLP
jgi:hypothetical protein